MAEFHNMSAPGDGDDDTLFALALRGTVEEPDMAAAGLPAADPFMADLFASDFARAELAEVDVSEVDFAEPELPGLDPSEADPHAADLDRAAPADPLAAVLGPYEAAIGLERAMAALQAELDEANRLDALFLEAPEPLPEPVPAPQEAWPPRPDPGAILWPKLVEDLRDTLLCKDAEIAALRDARDEALGTTRRLEAKIACLQHRIDSEAAIRRYREAGLTAA